MFCFNAYILALLLPLCSLGYIRVFYDVNVMGYKIK